MAKLVKAGEATAARRRAYFHLVDATDGFTPETGEAGGQPQISTNGAAWTATGIGALTAIGNGRYYADLTALAVGTSGDGIETRYKSANTAECPGDSFQVVAHDPYDLVGAVWGATDTDHDTAGTMGYHLNLLTAASNPNLSGSEDTVISGTAAYCARAEFLDRWDERTVGRLLSRTGTALTEAQILSSTELLEYLMEASGLVESACLRGGRYNVASLQALQSGAGTNSGRMLAGLVADLAMWRLWDSRPDREGKLPARCELAFRKLDQLDAGEVIFGLAASASAGRMDHRHRTPAQVVTNNDAIVIASRRFGTRSDRDPDNRA